VPQDVDRAVARRRQAEVPTGERRQIVRPGDATERRLVAGAPLRRAGREDRPPNGDLLAERKPPALARRRATRRRLLRDCTTGSGHRGAARLLDHRTRDGAEGAEHAAIAPVRAQHCPASGAVVEKLAGVGWHRLDLRHAAQRADDRGLQNDRVALMHRRSRDTTARAPQAGPPQ
jgi:hypothetical protein